MSGHSLHNLPASFPDGYWAAPFDDSSSIFAVRIAVLVRDQPDALGGRLVTLRQTVDSQVFLGCLVDSAGSVQKWVEIAVQNLDGVQQSAPASKEALSNALLDQRWRQRFEALQQRDPGDVIAYGWETAHPKPLVIDLNEKRVMHPVEESSGKHWELCTNDALLTQRGLASYSASLDRCLHVPELGEQSLLAVVAGGANAQGGVDASSIINAPAAGRYVPLNLGGGLMLVRGFSPHDLESFLALLSGHEWKGLRHGRSALQWKSKASSHFNGASATEQGSLFLDRHGRWGRLVESFHLKLRVLLDAVIAVREETVRTQMPLLNISPASFRVHLGDGQSGLPYLWSAQADLATPGEAVALPIPSSEATYVLRAGMAGVSIYQPDVAMNIAGGRGQVRLRQFIDDGGGGVTLDGTLTTQERLHLATNDLLWIRMPLANRKVELYGCLSGEAGTARGEYRFRTVSQRFDADIAKSLRAAEGVPIGNCSFEVIPLLSSPCDLYSLAVIAVQGLLVNSETSLPVALDAALSLAREAAAEHDAQVGLRLRIQSTLEKRPEWLDALGPQRLSEEPMSPNEALDLIPPDVWWDALGLIVRMFPGVGPDSFSRDYGDAPSGAIHKTYDPVIEALTTLVIRTRSLVVIDWRFNREIHSVIRRFAVQHAGDA